MRESTRRVRAFIAGKSRVAMCAQLVCVPLGGTRASLRHGSRKQERPLGTETGSRPICITTHAVGPPARLAAGGAVRCVHEGVGLPKEVSEAVGKSQLRA